MLNLVLILIFLIVAAAMWFQGLWSSVVTLINMFLAMMLAFNYFEPLADLIEKQDRSYTYLVDFLCLWGLFVVSFGFLRLFTRHACPASASSSISGPKRSGAAWWRCGWPGCSSVSCVPRCIPLRWGPIRWVFSRPRPRGIFWAWPLAASGSRSCRVAREGRFHARKSDASSAFAPARGSGRQSPDLRSRKPVHSEVLSAPCQFCG